MSSGDSTTLGDYLRVLRDESGTSQKELSDQLGGASTQSQISKWERGVSIPTDRTLERLSEILHEVPDFDPVKLTILAREARERRDEARDADLSPAAQSAADALKAAVRAGDAEWPNSPAGHEVVWIVTPAGRREIVMPMSDLEKSALVAFERRSGALFALSPGVVEYQLPLTDAQGKFLFDQWAARVSNALGGLAGRVAQSQVSRRPESKAAKTLLTAEIERAVTAVAGAFEDESTQVAAKCREMGDKLVPEALAVANDDREAEKAVWEVWLRTLENEFSEKRLTASSAKKHGLVATVKRAMIRLPPDLRRRGMAALGKVGSGGR